MRCPRCRRETNASTMSRFNTEMICLDCDERETNHPLYKQAAEAELAAVHAGNYNYAGVGCPRELYQPEKQD